MRGEYVGSDGVAVTADLEIADRQLSRLSLTARSAGAGDAGEERLAPVVAALTGLAADVDVRTMTGIIEKVWPGSAGGLATSIAIAVRRAARGTTSWGDLTFDVIGPVNLPVATHVALDQVIADDVRAGRRNPTFRIVGSFQSVRNEVDPDNAAKYGFGVVRRISGGGAMFMPPGTCITYSLTVPGSLTEGLSFEQSYAFLDAWVLDALAAVGVRARYVPLNDIASDKGKIGGAAQRRFVDGTVLHHVTSAYAMDMGLLAQVLRLGREPISKKGTASANKWVDPMCSQTTMSRDQVMASFLASFTSRYRCVEAGYSDDQLGRAAELVRTKFAADEWTYRVP